MRSSRRPAPARQIDTASLQYNHVSYTVGDYVEFKQDLRGPWRKGNVVGLGLHELSIEPQHGGAQVTIQPGRKGRVRKPHGGNAAQVPAGLDPDDKERALSRLHIDGVFTACAVSLPPVRVVRTDGSLHAIPKPDAPARCPAFLAFVQEHACTSCAAPAPSEAHHQGRKGVGQKCSDFLCVPLCHACHFVYTSTGALPGRSRASSLALMMATQVKLLQRWAELRAKEAGALVRVPLLRLVAAGFAVLLAGCERGDAAAAALPPLFLLGLLVLWAFTSRPAPAAHKSAPLAASPDEDPAVAAVVSALLGDPEMVTKRNRVRDPAVSGDHDDPCDPYEPTEPGPAPTDDLSWITEEAPSDGGLCLVAVPPLPNPSTVAQLQSVAHLRDLLATIPLPGVPRLPTAEDIRASHAGSVFAHLAAEAQLPEIPPLPPPPFPPLTDWTPPWAQAVEVRS